MFVYADLLDPVMATNSTAPIKLSKFLLKYELLNWTAKSLHDEWREMLVSDLLKSIETLGFWKKMSEINTPTGSPRFAKGMVVIRYLLSLPSLYAVVEHIFIVLKTSKLILGIIWLRTAMQTKAGMRRINVHSESIILNQKLTKRIMSVEANMTVEECQTLASIQREALASGADAVADMQW